MGNITKWAIKNEPSDNMSYKKSYWAQIIFIRDIIVPLLFDEEIDDSEDFTVNLERYQKLIDDNVKIISTHFSKSIGLPVFHINFKGCSITMRDNFHGWNISIKSPIEVDFPDNIFTKDNINYCFFEGFPKESIIKNPYLVSKKEFSCEVRSEFLFFTFMFLLKDQLKNEG